MRSKTKAILCMLITICIAILLQYVEREQSIENIENRVNINVPTKNTPKLEIKAKTIKNNQRETSKKVNNVAMDVPSKNSFKSYMDSKHIRGISDQLKLKSKYALDNTGVWKVDDRYCIAVGSYYTTEIGTYIDIVMNNGTVIECILADCKADCDTDKTNRQNPNGSIVEFVVETNSLSSLVKKMGDCSYCKEEWQGEIKSIIVYK